MLQIHNVSACPQVQVHYLLIYYFLLANPFFNHLFACYHLSWNGVSCHSLFPKQSVVCVDYSRS